MEARKSKLDGVMVLGPSVAVEDLRGVYVETFNRKKLAGAGVDIDWVADSYSVSSKHVLRGFHGDDFTWKLITCLSGRIYLVVVNWDEGSPQYKRWDSFVLSSDNKLQVLVPPKFGNAHLVLSEEAVFFYKQSAYYDRAKQFTLMWDDPRIKAWWPVKDPILSPRDAGMEEK